MAMNIEWKKTSRAKVTKIKLYKKLNEPRNHYRKAKHTVQHKEVKLQWAKEHPDWFVDNRSNVVINDESKNCIQGMIF